MKKYKLTDESITTECGKKLFRIEAVKDFGEVKKGDKGGFIQCEQNLSHDGDSWVSGDALVYGNACVYDDACVCDNAWVFDDACVSGDVRVSGDEETK